jgi:hypothetical protein
MSEGISIEFALRDDDFSPPFKGYRSTGHHEYDLHIRVYILSCVGDWTWGLDGNWIY